MEKNQYPTKPSLKGKDFIILDSIRAIAALFVVVSHCRGVLWIGGSEFLKRIPRETWSVVDYLVFAASMLTRVATEFVIVFFVLSGFSIAFSLSSNKSISQFYKRRFIRLYPPYIAALAWAGIVFLLTKFWFPQWYDGSITEFSFVRTNEMRNYFTTDVMVSNLLYMPIKGFIVPFWSLTYEIIFYLLAPFVLRYTNGYLVISILFFFIGLTTSGERDINNWTDFIYNYVFVYNIYFAAGIALFKYYDTCKALIKSWSMSSGVITMILLLGIIFGLNFYFKVSVTTYSFVISAILGMVMILFFLRENVRIPWLINIGKYSYTLYITHFASIYLYLGIYWLIAKPREYFILNFWVWIPAVFFCLIIAYLQYLLVEKRTKDILGKWRSKLSSAEGPSVILANKA